MIYVLHCCPLIVNFATSDATGIHTTEINYCIVTFMTLKLALSNAIRYLTYHGQNPLNINREINQLCKVGAWVTCFRAVFHWLFAIRFQ